MHSNGFLLYTFPLRLAIPNDDLQIRIKPATDDDSDDRKV
jgi:hypothetical protein